VLLDYSQRGILLTEKGLKHSSKPSDFPFFPILCFTEEPTISCMLLESDRASRYLSHSRIYLSLTLRANVDSSRMHLWFWVPMAFLCFINVTSLPMNREGALDESRGIDQRSYVPRRELSEIITTRIVHQEKGQPEEESVDCGQKRLESLRISTGAKLGHILVQPGKHFRYPDR